IDPWLSAHMSDMMEHINILGVCRRVFAVEPREHYVIELGEVYMSHEDLWRVGLEYLGMSGSSGGGCAGAGAAVMEEYAMRIPLESDRKAEQVLRTCAAHGLQRAADRIHRQLGRQKWQQGRLGAAITHFAQARDHRSVGLVCDQLWAAYLESGGSGDLAYGPTIDGVLAATGVRHDRLDFLSRYRDFHACYGAGDPVAAGRILLAIITAGIAPPHAVRDLLVDAIPLLEGDALVFSADDTFELLRRAEEEKRDRAGDSSSSSSSEMSVFSVACARNLARAFVAA
ncbi:Nucleoporin nup85, partial [Coemansia sp. RSA 2049]